MSGPVLTTRRLILRPLEAEDFEPFAAMMALESTRFIGGPMVPSVAWRMFMTLAGAWSIDGFSMFSVVERDTGRWIGRVGPWRPLGWPGNEVGWAITPDVQGRGYAVEAAGAAIGWAFDHLDWDDVIHCIAPDNGPSQGVARRLGSENRGPGRMPPPLEAYPIDLWGQSRQAWRARFAAAPPIS